MHHLRHRLTSFVSEVLLVDVWQAFLCLVLLFLLVHSGILAIGDARMHPLVLLLGDVGEPLHEQLRHLVDRAGPLKFFAEKQPLNLALQAVADLLVGLFRLLLVVLLSLLLLVLELVSDLLLGHLQGQVEVLRCRVV